MAEVNPMVAVGDSVRLVLSKGVQSTICAVISSSAAASFTALLEVSADDEVTYETATFTKADRTTAASLTATGISGQFDASGYTHARLRLTAITTPSTGVVGRINQALASL